MAQGKRFGHDMFCFCAGLESHNASLLHFIHKSALAKRAINVHFEPMHTPYSHARLRAVLGATNTGKTHLALTRMLAHKSGMIGLPLRLLAREVYDRVIAGHFGRVHRADVALITGEEKILPPSPRYFICTTEAMPMSRAVAFAALDECQLAGDAERGHIFTDRILHMRGTDETMFMGATTIAPVLKKHLADIEIETRARLSQLTHIGAQKLSRLPRRTAIIAFSANDIYALAELIRRQYGGAAVVMGGLSPRTRNAQVAMYQSGEVDFLVATDAIGMGLNMDINHIAFARTRKFDGRHYRDLTPAECAQIAGRAGRHKADGTFGTTTDTAILDEEMIARIENHDFESIKTIMWRNHRLDFTTLANLIASLERPAPHHTLMRAPQADDLRALKMLAADSTITDRLVCEDRLRQLWEVAQIPDYRKITAGAHSALIARIFEFRSTANGVIPADWLTQQIEACNRIDGDIDALATRLAHIRTWAYVANRAHWLDDAAHWQGESRKVETRLSDALHTQLMGKFVERKNAVLMRHLAKHDAVRADITPANEIRIAGETLGQVRGLTIERAPNAHDFSKSAMRKVRAAFDEVAQRALRQQAALLARARPHDFTLDMTGAIHWRNAPIAHIAIPADNNTAYLAPMVQLHADDRLAGAPRQLAEQCVMTWVRAHIAARLAPLCKLIQAQDLHDIGEGIGRGIGGGIGRGLAFRLAENYGNLPRAQIAPVLAQLTPAARRKLRHYGVRFGARTIYLPNLLKPQAAHLLALSAACATDKIDALAHLPAAGLTSSRRTSKQAKCPAHIYRAAGYHPTRHYVIRFDMLERVANILRPLVQADADFHLDATTQATLLSLMGCNRDTLIDMLTELDFCRQASGRLIWTQPMMRHTHKKRAPKKARRDSPFAALRDLKATMPKPHRHKKPITP